MVVSSSTKPSWRLGAGDQYNCQYCLVSSLMAWMLGQSALSASLKVFATKKKKKKRLIPQMGVLPPRVTFGGWRNGHTVTA